MPISVQDLVAPAAGAAPAAAPAAPDGAQPTPGLLTPPYDPKDEADATIPDDVLKIPAFRALLEGSPPAVIVKRPELEANPELQTIQQNVKPLLASGFGVYQAKDGQTAVFYNSRFIDGNALKIADDKGKLDTVAAPFADLKSHFDQALGPEGAAAAPEAAAPAPVASTTPPAPAAQAKLSTARLMSAAPGAPTSGPVPGQGRVLSQILKPAV